MGRRYFKGGYYTRTGLGTSASDGDFNEDDSSGGADSNWVDEFGVGAAKPTSSDTVYLTGGMCDRVPVNYSDSTYPHVAGNHWSLCINLGQGALNVQNFYVTSDYTGNIYGLYSAVMNDAVAVGQPSYIYPDEVEFTIDDNPFEVGDYITPSGTDYYDNEYRVLRQFTNQVVVHADYFAETLADSDTVTGKRPLRISVAAGGEMIIEGTGVYYIECDNTHRLIPSLTFNSVSGYLHISSEEVGCDWASVLVLGGGTLVAPRRTSVGTVTVTADSTATVIGADEIGGDSGGTPTVFNVHGGTVTWDSSIGVSVFTGGTFNNCPNVSPGLDVTIEGFTGYGGIFNMYGRCWLKNYVNYGTVFTALGDGYKTLGSDEVALGQYGGTLDLRQSIGDVVLYDESAASAFIDNQGGNFYPPKRQSITW